MMLDAHPGLHSMDEQRYIQDALSSIMERGIRYPQELSRLTPADVADLRARYWRSVPRSSATA